MNIVQTTVSNILNETSKWTLGSSVICFTAAAEMGIRALGNIASIINSDDDSHSSARWKNLSANLAGCLVFGLAGFNPLPGAARVAALGFFAYSGYLELHDKDNSYLLSKVIIQPITKILWPIVKGIVEIAADILKSIPLPEHPMWYVGALFLTAVSVYNYSTIVAYFTSQQFASIVATL